MKLILDHIDPKNNNVVLMQVNKLVSAGLVEVRIVKTDDSKSIFVGDDEADFDENTNEEAMKKRKMIYAGGKRNKGISGTNLVIKTIHDARRPVSIEDITLEFQANGFAPSSAPSTCSKMCRDGLITKNDDDCYELLPFEGQEQ